MRPWFFLCLSLGGCVSASARDDGVCRGYGAERGTGGYAACRLQLAEHRRQVGLALIGLGAAVASPPVGPAPSGLDLRPQCWEDRRGVVLCR